MEAGPPALVPEATAGESSVARVLAAGGTVRSAPAMADDIEEVQRQLGVSSGKQDATGTAAEKQEDDR